MNTYFLHSKKVWKELTSRRLWGRTWQQAEDVASYLFSRFTLRVAATCSAAPTQVTYIVSRSGWEGVRGAGVRARLCLRAMWREKGGWTGTVRQMALMMETLLTRPPSRSHSLIIFFYYLFHFFCNMTFWAIDTQNTLKCLPSLASFALCA